MNFLQLPEVKLLLLNVSLVIKTCPDDFALLARTSDGNDFAQRVR